MEYGEFLKTKKIESKPSGFDIPDKQIKQALFPWQRQIVRWALRRGRAAIWAECGLGKTAMQLEWADWVSVYTNGPVLILTPLAVAPQTVREGEKFGIKVRLCKTQKDVAMRGIHVTNYQKLLAGHFDPSKFSGIVLDESSILKSYMGKTKRMLIEAFADTPYRLACTATPAPNDHMELGNHSTFLGVMDNDEILARWFINDPANVGHYRLKGHAADDFWRFVASWAVCLGKPSDLGYDDAGFALQPLNLHHHTIAVDHTDGRGDCLFRMPELNATTLHQEMRRTAPDRAAKVAELIAASPGTWLVWCNTDYEADELKRRIPLLVELRGSEAEEKKEMKLESFANGECHLFASKPSLAGFGLNWQHCHQVAFVGLSYSFEQFHQAVRRTWRFGQTKPVECHIVSAETEGAVLQAVREKMKDFETMRAEMVKATRSAASIADDEARSLTMVQSERREGEGWALHRGDCVEVVRTMKDASIDFTVFSPPFSSLYIYSDALQDMGNSADDAEFFQHFGYLIPHLYRVTTPGRLCAVHCKDLPKYAVRDGIAGLKDFPGELIRRFEAHGWSYHSRVTVWKCPVVERERTNNNGLLHKTVMRDSSQVRQGMADYVLVFRRPPAEGDGLMSAKPIVRPNGIETYAGDPDHDPRMNREHPSRYSRRKMPSDPSIAIWQRYADPVWWDIDQRDVLNKEQASEERDEKHICPLQLGLIRRCVELWSQPGDTVLSPFAGIGSEGVVALQARRRFIGVELKESYWKTAIRNLEKTAEEARQKTLFDAA